MNYLSRLSIKSRLLLMLLGVSLTAILIVGILSVRTAQSALRQSIDNQLTSIRVLKARQLESYYAGLLSATRVLAESKGVINAMEGFQLGYREGIEQTLTPEQQQQVTVFYAEEFLPRLAANMDETPLLALYRPQRQAASYFQYHYIVNNPLPEGRRDELFVAEGDTTTYRRIHEASHPFFRSLRNEFGYQDLLLIDIDTGNVVYRLHISRSIWVMT